VNGKTAQPAQLSGDAIRVLLTSVHDYVCLNETNPTAREQHINAALADAAATMKSATIQSDF